MKRDTEGSLQHIVSWVLRGGVLASAAAGILALALHMASEPGKEVDFRAFRGTPEPDRQVGLILRHAVHMEPRSLMMLAILLLLLTPITRVAVSLVGFIKEKDRVYVVITTAVLLTLLASLFFGAVTE